MENNLEFWQKVNKTDKKALKEVSFGRKFTAIDPYWQIRKATEVWGMYGNTWGFKSIELSYELIYKDIVVFKGLFYYPEGEFPIINAVHIMTSTDANKAKIDSDFAKKVETDTLTKALSKLGFSADIFLSKFDDIKPDIIESSLENIDMFTLISDIKTKEDCSLFIKEYAPLLNKDASLRQAFSQKKKEV